LRTVREFHIIWRMVTLYITVVTGSRMWCSALVDELCYCQEIDGKALLLLTSEMMMKYMGLKLGPALKLCNAVEKLKSLK